MMRVLTSAARQASVALALALMVTFCVGAHARTTLPPIPLQQQGADSAASAASSLLEQLDDAKAQLEQVLAQREQQAVEQQGQSRPDLAPDRRRLLDWLLDLQREKVKRLEDLIAFRTKTPALDADPLVKVLRGDPPYSAVQVDALRDEIDGLKEKLAADEAGFRANRIEMQNLNERLKARAASSRLAGERPLGAGPDAGDPGAREELEILTLLERVAEVEIAISALEETRLELQIASWRQRIEDMQAVVARALPDQRLTPEDVAALRQRLRLEQEKLASEIASMTRQIALRRGERERLGASGQAIEGEKDRHGAFLDLALKAENAMLKGLDQLLMLSSVTGDAWEKRHIVLSGSDPEQRRTALKALDELRRKLADLRSPFRSRQETLRTEIRTQRVRIDNLAGDRREQGREMDLLNLLLRQTAMEERVELGVARLEKQVSRWLADFADPADLGWPDRARQLRERVTSVLDRLWNRELFVAEDVSEVAGQRVTVKYGVTVGKSIGIFVVFIVGYWLLATISRFIQVRLVRWFKVSPQLASVLRRWVMIGLSVALVVLILNLARIPLSVFAFLGGALAIGFGFGAQNIIKNFISGLIMLFERKVRVGDFVELGGVSGHVTAVDLRATTVLGFNGVEALIPNASFIENQVINWTYSNQQVRRELPVDIAYGCEVHQAEALLLAAAAEHPCVLPDPPPQVFFDGFGDSALKVVLVYWVEFEGAKGPRRVDSDLRHDIHARLAASGISIPFPQREVLVRQAAA